MGTVGPSIGEPIGIVTGLVVLVEVVTAVPVCDVLVNDDDGLSDVDSLTVVVEVPVVAVVVFMNMDDTLVTGNELEELSDVLDKVSDEVVVKVALIVLEDDPDEIEVLVVDVDVAVTELVPESVSA